MGCSFWAAQALKKTTARLGRGDARIRLIYQKPHAVVLKADRRWR
jgi:hypothetical protein